MFAGVFVPGSVHEGTITGRAGQNFVVSLAYGVEGTVSVKHLKKADGSKAELEDKLPFMVLEFNGEARRIVLSHTRTFEEGEEPIELAPAKRGARKEAGSPAGGSAVKAVNDKVEKSAHWRPQCTERPEERHGEQGARFERQEERRGRGR